MISASGNKGDAGRNSHSGDFSFVRKLHFYQKRRGGEKRNTVFHRLLGHAALSWKNGVVCHKCHQVFFYKLFTDVLLIFSQENCCFQGFLIQVLVVQRFFHTNREEFKKDFFQFTGINGPAIGWEANSKSHGDFFFGNLAGAAL